MAVDPPGNHDGRRRPEAEADPHGGRADGLLPSVVEKGGVAREKRIS